jgi:serine/threonine protein kinase
MNVNADVNPTQDERLGEVIAAYLRDCEAGNKPDQAAILARHPDLADELQDFFSGYQQLGRLAAPLRQAVEPNPDPEQTTEPSGETVGSMIAGRYKLLELIGQGGMGQVWMAQQREPVKRLVALKLIKVGMDSQAVLTRFEAERQALALMDHANIAKVFDGGTTAAGRPYFVMELVKGLPLTTYCDERHLTVRQRLELFVQVCAAVQHAHQKGIIHRDLKPTNILVTEYDGRPVPKVIDFGLAKALTATNVLTEHTLHTAFGAMVGTPLYMAPEQVGINALDVDTRSDVYALGVLLYELLTGTTPFDRETFKKASYDEMRRIIREDEPPRPSARLSTTAQGALSTLAERRGLEPRRLSQQLRGELDWIVMKALEKDRSRRYESASAFAADVRSYLEDEPVQACPPSQLYRLRKFARRHKAGLAVAAFLLLTMIGLFVSTMVSVAAYQSEATQHRIADDERRTAERERDSAKRHLYAATFQLARAAFEAGEMDRVQTLLENQVPAVNQEDLRGWEWHYLDALYHRDWLTVAGISTNYKQAAHSVAWSPDGRYLAVGMGKGSGEANQPWAHQRGKYAGSGGEVKVWEVSTRQEVLNLRHSAAVGLTGWSPDGKRLAAAIEDRVQVWDAMMGQEIVSSVKGHPYDGSTYVHSTHFAWSPDGKRGSGSGVC